MKDTKILDIKILRVLVFIFYFFLISQFLNSCPPDWRVSISSPVFAQVTLAPLKGLPGAYEPGEGIEGAGTTLSKIFTNTFGLMTIIAGLMFILYFILGGLSWLTAGGKAEQVQKAKQQMTNAVIGLIIVVAAYGITFIVGTVLGIPILEPEKFLYEIFPGFEEAVTKR